MTLSEGIFTSTARSSSAMPSAKYSWSCFSLISENGSTAMDFSVAADVEAAMPFGGTARHGCHASSTTAAATATTAAILQLNFRGNVNGSARLMPGSGAGGASAAPNRAAIRVQNAAGVAPLGNRVHCARRNDSGTSAPRSRVSSMHTGTINALLRATMCVRWSARSHSSRKYPSGRSAVCCEMIGIKSAQSRICCWIFWSQASPPRSSVWSNHTSTPIACSASHKRCAAAASSEA